MYADKAAIITDPKCSKYEGLLRINLIMVPPKAASE